MLCSCIKYYNSRPSSSSSSLSSLELVYPFTHGVDSRRFQRTTIQVRTSVARSNSLPRPHHSSHFGVVAPQKIHRRQTHFKKMVHLGPSFPRSLSPLSRPNQHRSRNATFRKLCRRTGRMVHHRHCVDGRILLFLLETIYSEKEEGGRLVDPSPFEDQPQDELATYETYRPVNAAAMSDNDLGTYQSEYYDPVE